MVEKKSDVGRTGRRGLLWQVSGAGAAVASGLVLGKAAGADDAPAIARPTGPAKELLPTIALGPHRVTRLVAGWNPIGGHSHTTVHMSRAMREYFTPGQIVEFLLRCEHQGINAWQYDHTDEGVQALQMARQMGSKLQCICLHAERGSDATIAKVLKDTAPIAIVHHGGVTDSMFRAGQGQKVHDFVKKVHDAGVLAGVSAHCPENIQRIADEGWENDLFMACFYYVTRSAEDQQRLLGKVTVGEPYFESDPAEMTAVMRQVPKPCLGFKILAAGRSCWNKDSVEGAFQFAFANIKPSDGVIVGMFPKYEDEIAADADYARKHGAAG